MPMEISTKVKFRRLEFRDLPYLLRLRSDESGYHRHLMLNSELQEEWYRSLDRHPAMPRDLVLVAGTEEISHLGVVTATLDWISRSADVSWGVFPEHRGIGHGKNLVKASRDYFLWNLNLRRLCTEIVESNLPSIKCAESAGYHLEGRKRRAVIRGAKYEDSLIYGLLQHPSF